MAVNTIPSDFGSGGSGLNPTADPTNNLQKILSDHATAINNLLTGGIAPGDLPLTALAHQADQTVVGNVSGGSASPIALNKTQVTALVNPATGSLPGAMTAAQFSALAGLNAASVGGAMQAAYSAVIDLVAGPTGLYVVIPPTPARIYTVFYGWEIKTTGGTISVSPTFSAGSNSASFNNLFASQTNANFKTTGAEISALPNLINPIPVVDLTTSGLQVNITALATGSTPVLTARFMIQYALVPV